jgi:hypothetical protein
MLDLKSKIRAVMLDHLQTKGYPETSSQQILAELKPMWIKLEEAQLTAGWNFLAFYATAHQMAEQDMLFRILRGEKL